MAEGSQITVNDIAREAGVAQTTVSSALHGTGRVGEATRRRIKRVAREMGYEPRLAAQLLRRRKTGQLGILVAARNGDPLDGPLYRRLISRFVSRCERQGRGYHIGVHFHGEADSEFRPPMFAAGRLVDGVILAGDGGDRLRAWLTDVSRLPWVSIMEPAPLCVLPVDDRATERVVEYLVSLGHRRIAHVAEDQRYLTQRLRHGAFIEAIEKYGLELAHEDWVQIIERMDELDVMEEERAKLAWVERLLGRAVRPTAIIGAQRQAIYVGLRRGLAVPGDLSVVGWELPEIAARDFYPSLTCVDGDPETMLDAAWELLEERLAGKSPEQPVRRIEPRLVVGQTTGPLRSVEAKS